MSTTRSAGNVSSVAVTPDATAKSTTTVPTMTPSRYVTARRGPNVEATKATLNVAGPGLRAWPRRLPPTRSPRPLSSR